MHIVHVFFNVKLDKIEKFKEISLENSKNDLQVIANRLVTIGIFTFFRRLYIRSWLYQ